MILNAKTIDLKDILGNILNNYTEEDKEDLLIKVLERYGYLIDELKSFKEHHPDTVKRLEEIFDNFVLGIPSDATVIILPIINDIVSIILK